MYSLLFLAASSLLTCLALTPLCRDVFRRAGLVDRPDRVRKTHLQAIPRIGGIPIAIAYAGSFLLLLASPLNAGLVVSRNLPLIWNLLPAFGLIFATGLIDDLAGLTCWQKLTGQLAASVCAWCGGVQILRFAGYSTGAWWSLPLTVAWLVACSNAFNLIDGVDGVATGLGLFATVALLFLALAQGNLPLALAIAPLAGALLGFLLYNFNPASIFLGDSGSLLVGFLLGCYGVIWSRKAAALLALTTPLMALAIPILDVCLSIARRFLQGRPIFAADRGHIHHRLLDRGLPPKRVALLLYAAGGLGALFSMLESLAPERFLIPILIIFCGSILIFVKSLRYTEFGVARRVLLSGALRRLVGARIHLRNLEMSLESAATPHDCWLAVQEGCRLLGFHNVQAQLLGETYKDLLGTDAGPACWTMRIPLSERDYVSCSRRIESAVETDGLVTFAHLLGKQLRLRLAALAAPVEKSKAAYGSANVMSAAPAATATYCLPSNK